MERVEKGCGPQGTTRTPSAGASPAATTRGGRTPLPRRRGSSSPTKLRNPEDWSIRAHNFGTYTKRFPKQKKKTLGKFPKLRKIAWEIMKFPRKPWEIIKIHEFSLKIHEKQRIFMTFQGFLGNFMISQAIFRSLGKVPSVFFLLGKSFCVGPKVMCTYTR